MVRLPWWLSIKECAGQCRRRGFDPQVGKIPWRRKWHPTPVFLPGEFHGLRTLPRATMHGVTESDMTERLTRTHSNYAGAPSGSVVKNPPANAGDIRDMVLSLGPEDPLEKEIATHSSILAWEVPWTKEPGGLQSMGSEKSWT